MKIERVWQISERGRKQANFSAGILKFLGGSGLGGFVQQGVRGLIFLPSMSLNNFLIERTASMYFIKYLRIKVTNLIAK